MNKKIFNKYQLKKNSEHLGMDAIWVLLVTESWISWRWIQIHFFMTQYGLKFKLMNLYNKEDYSYKINTVWKFCLDLKIT